MREDYSILSTEYKGLEANTELVRACVWCKLPPFRKRRARHTGLRAAPHPRDEGVGENRWENKIKKNGKMGKKEGLVEGQCTGRVQCVSVWVCGCVGVWVWVSETTVSRISQSCRCFGGC